MYALAGTGDRPKTKGVRGDPFRALSVQYFVYRLQKLPDGNMKHIATNTAKIQQHMYACYVFLCHIFISDLLCRA